MTASHDTGRIQRRRVARGSRWHIAQQSTTESVSLPCASAVALCDDVSAWGGPSANTPGSCEGGSMSYCFCRTESGDLPVSGRICGLQGQNIRKRSVDHVELTSVFRERE